MIGYTSTASVSQSIVNIDRDQWGVPHIYADTDEGGYYGLGYAMSEDRFERLIEVVLFARGEAWCSMFCLPASLFATPPRSAA
jgi:acyl-homoserine lactone acylase PvdQ